MVVVLQRKDMSQYPAPVVALVAGAIQAHMRRFLQPYTHFKGVLVETALSNHMAVVVAVLVGLEPPLPVRFPGMGERELHLA